MTNSFTRYAARLVALAGLAWGCAQAQTSPASPTEIYSCSVPTQIAFVSEDVGPSPNFQVQRYVRYPNGVLSKMVPQPGYATGKNPNMDPNAAPYQATDCTPGSGFTQWASFRVRTQNYFSSGIADHLLMTIRADMTPSSYDAIGPIFFPTLNGIQGERASSVYGNQFQPTPSPQLPLNDNHTYLVEILADPHTISYRITNETGGGTTGWTGFSHAGPPMAGTGFFFAVLCAGTPGRHCDNWTSTPFRVDFWDITMGFV